MLGGGEKVQCPAVARGTAGLQVPMPVIDAGPGPGAACSSCCSLIYLALERRLLSSAPRCRCPSQGIVLQTSLWGKQDVFHHRSPAVHSAA